MILYKMQTIGNITLQLVINDVYVWICILGLLSQMWITSYLWKSGCKNQQLHNPFYCSLLIDQSMIFNYRREEVILESGNISANDSPSHIYICATMWHENVIEMTTFLKSIFTIDKENSSSCSTNEIQQVSY